MTKEKTENKKYPRLFHIGTQKAGSTYLYNLFADHPDVSLHEHSKVNFFCSNYEKGFDWYLDGFEEKGERIDTSPKCFLQGETAASRIREYVDRYLKKEPRFLLVLRNPADYLNSHFQMHLEQGFFKKRADKYPEITDNLVDFIQMYPNYLERAKYAKLLKSYWLKHFDLNQFKIVLFEDLIEKEQETMSKILEFFELEQYELESPKLSKNIKLRFSFLKKIRKSVNQHPGIKKYLKNSRLFNYAHTRLLSTSTKRKLKGEDRAKIQQYLMEDIKELEQFLNKDLTYWKK